MEAFLENRQYNSSLRVWACCYTDLCFLPHYHTEMEIIYVRQGCAHIGINNHTYICHSGDLIICHSGDMHYSNHDDDQNILDFIIFDPSVLSGVYLYDRTFQPVISANELGKTGMEYICKRMFQNIHQELKSKAIDYDVLIKLYLVEFWVKYTRYFSHQRNNDSFRPFVTALASLQKLVDYVEQNYASDVNLSDAAEIMGYEISHCSKMFKKLTGVNFTQYVNNVRIGKAIEIMRKFQYSITEVGMMCGFNNIRTFNRVFKNLTKMTPTEFLATNRITFKPETSKQQNHMTSTIISYQDSWD